MEYNNTNSPRHILQIRPGCGGVLFLALLAVLVLCGGDGGLVQAANVVQVDITRTGQTATKEHRGGGGGAVRRATIEEPMTNSVILYYSNVSIGTPPQEVRLQVDTGSSDCLLLSTFTSLCREDIGKCPGGVFNEKKSTTYKALTDNFTIAYADKTGASGDYITDNLEVGGITVKDMKMALIKETDDIYVGILAIGYATNQVNYISGDDSSLYPSLLEQMVSQGLIQTKAYSMWLNSLDSSTGSILFGGVDTEKYSGALVKIPFRGSSKGTFKEFTVPLTSFAVINTENSSSSGNDEPEASTLTPSDYSAPAVLDSGTSLTYISRRAAREVRELVGAFADGKPGQIECSKKSLPYEFEFGFGGGTGLTIRVPMKEMVIQDSKEDGRAVCHFGIYPTDSDELLLGDTFLRSTYVVYDLDNNASYMAQAKNNATDSNVLEITPGPDGVPGVSTGGSRPGRS